MTGNYYTILTNIGKAKIANSTVLGTKVDLVTMTVGNSNNIPYNPTEEQTTLVNEVWRGNINSVSTDPQNPNWIEIYSIIPPANGGFKINEVGIFDSVGDLIAIAKYPETYKPVAEEGSTKDLGIKIILEVTNTTSVTLKVDPTVIIASRKDLLDHANKVASTTQTGHVKLNNTLISDSANEALTAAQGKALKDDIESQKADLTYQVAGGTATAITLTLSTLVNGYAKTFIASANNEGNATTINGKSLYKPNTTDTPNLVVGKAYTVWYSSAQDCFFIKASATGTVTSDKVLAGETYSTEEDTDLVGTMDLSNLIPSNIRNGVTINGVMGDKLKYGIGDHLSASNLSEKTPLTIYSKESFSTIRGIVGEDNNNIYYLYYSGNTYKILIVNKLTRAYTFSNFNVGSTIHAFFSNNDGYFYILDNALIRKVNSVTGAEIWSCGVNYSPISKTRATMYGDETHVYAMYFSSPAMIHAKVTIGGALVSSVSKNTFGADNYFLDGTTLYSSTPTSLCKHDIVSGNLISKIDSLNILGFVDYINPISYSYANSKVVAKNFNGVELWSYAIGNTAPTGIIPMSDGVYIDHYFGQDVKLGLDGQVLYFNNQTYVGISGLYYKYGNKYLLGFSGVVSDFITPAKIQETISIGG